jgi:hypothetical protein
VKKQKLLTGMIALLLAAVLLPAVSTHAAEQTTSDGDEQTTGSILLTRGTAPTIISAPTFNFGTHLTLATAMKFYAEPGTSSVSGDAVNAPAQSSGSASTATTAADMSLPMSTDSMQLIVRNPGFDSGWQVTVTAGEFTRNSDQRLLKGAVLTVGNKAAVDSGNTATGDSDNAGQVTAGADDQDPSGKPSSPISDNASFTLQLSKDSAATPIFSAAANENQGVRTWNLNFGSGNVSLDIPAGNVVGDYSADLTWTLANAPQ